jgi:hypothetical protein
MFAMGIGWWLSTMWNQEAVIERRTYNTNQFSGLYELWAEVERQWRFNCYDSIYGPINMRWAHQLSNDNQALVMTVIHKGIDFHRQENSFTGGNHELTKYVATKICNGFIIHIKEKDYD